MQTKIILLNFEALVFFSLSRQMSLCVMQWKHQFQFICMRNVGARIFFQVDGMILIRLFALSLTLIRLNNLIVIVVVGNRIANKFCVFRDPKFNKRDSRALMAVADRVKTTS